MGVAPGKAGNKLICEDPSYSNFSSLESITYGGSYKLQNKWRQWVNKFQGGAKGTIANMISGSCRNSGGGKSEDRAAPFSYLCSVLKIAKMCLLDIKLFSTSLTFRLSKGSIYFFSFSYWEREHFNKRSWSMSMVTFHLSWPKFDYNILIPSHTILIPGTEEEKLSEIGVSNDSQHMLGGKARGRKGSAMEKTHGPLSFLPHVGPFRCFQMLAWY